MTKSLIYKVNYLRNQGLFYTVLGKDYYSGLYNEAWTPIDHLLEKYETAWTEETYLSNRNLPKNTIWIELETGFRLLIEQKSQPEIYADFLEVINDYGNQLKEALL